MNIFHEQLPENIRVSSKEEISLPETDTFATCAHI